MPFIGRGPIAPTTFERVATGRAISEQFGRNFTEDAAGVGYEASDWGLSAQ